MLPRKQKSNQSDWLEVLENIDLLISKSEIESLIDKTVERIKKDIKGKRVAFGWSGGKDSLVVQYLCKEIGFQDCIFAITDLEYPAFTRWSKAYMPAEIEIINNGFDLIWLSENPDMLFPQDAKTAAKWFKLVQHDAQSKYFKKHHLDMLLLGRRLADGNFCGRGGSNVYTNRQGITRYSPIYDWTHEQALRCISYYEIKLPPIYFWSRGFRVGTGPWPARQWTGSIENGWSEIWQIDQSLVWKSASYLVSARDFLEREKPG
jgi:3'-phosphoadenosine 5'-phosphosulfate sulfotransferase (PAPS reductase)/FAD synthetase